MHRNLAIIVLISFKVICIQSNNLLNILVSEKNFFNKINLQLHTLTNKLFSSLNLDNEFTKNVKIKALLTMHSDLNSIAEKHSSIYDDIQNITSREVNQSTTDLEKLFKYIIFEESDQVKGEVENVTNTKSQNNDAYEIELEYFVNNVLDKIPNVFEDIVLASNKTRSINGFNIPKLRVKTREIKVWQPDESSENKSMDNIIARRIYKGKKTRVRKYPFLVSIHWKNEFSCAGSIISRDLVITAATCLHIAYNSSGELPRFFVRVGSDYTNRLGELIPVVEIIFHPGYDPASLKNNIAIIRIMKRVKFSNKRKIQRIQYDRNEDSVDDDKSVTILGWGAKDANSESSETHRVSIAYLDIYNFEECEDIYTRYYVTDRNFCAGFVSKGGGACNRDVGGPGIISGRLVGIISFGPLVCGMTGAPTVFTKIGHYGRWIDNIIRQKPKKVNAKTTKIPTKRPIRAYPKPILTTSNPINPVTALSDFHKGTTEVIYPDEISILRDILQEIVFSNSSIIDYILYGDMLAMENDAVNILTTTEKVDIYHHPLANHSIFLIERQNGLKISKQIADKNNDDLSNYEDTDTGIKILESLGEFHTFNEKSTTPNRFRVTNNNNLKFQDTVKVINSVENAGQQDNIPNGSSDYYEDESGISIEAPKVPIEKHLKKQNNHFEKASTRSGSHSFKRIKLEDYKNVILSLNPLRESRDVITIDRKHAGGGKERKGGNKIRNNNRVSFNPYR